MNDSTFSPVANGQGEKADAIGYELDNDEDDDDEGTRKLINFSLLVLHEEIPPISTMRARVASEKQQQQPTTRSKSWREEEVEGITRRRQWNKMKMHFLQRTR